MSQTDLEQIYSRLEQVKQEISWVLAAFKDPIASLQAYRLTQDERELLTQRLYQTLGECFVSLAQELAGRHDLFDTSPTFIGIEVEEILIQTGSPRQVRIRIESVGHITPRPDIDDTDQSEMEATEEFEADEAEVATEAEDISKHDTLSAGGITPWTDDAPNEPEGSAGEITPWTDDELTE